MLASDPCSAPWDAFRTQNARCDRLLRSYRAGQRRHSAAPRRQIVQPEVLGLRAELAFFWCFMHQPHTDRQATPPACRRWYAYDGSSDSGCSLYASSPRFSGASCTSLLPEVQLCRQPVGAETLTLFEVREALRRALCVAVVVASIPL